MGDQQTDTRARACGIGVFATSFVLGSDLEFKRPWKASVLPSYSLINSLRDARDSDLMQIEDAFKDPEDRFWEKNRSEGIVEVQSNPAISNSVNSKFQLFRGNRS